MAHWFKIRERRAYYMGKGAALQKSKRLRRKVQTFDKLERQSYRNGVKSVMGSGYGASTAPKKKTTAVKKRAETKSVQRKPWTQADATRLGNDMIDAMFETGRISREKADFYLYKDEL